MTGEPPVQPDLVAGDAFLDLLLGVIALGGVVEAQVEAWSGPGFGGTDSSDDDPVMDALLGALALARTSRHLVEALAVDPGPVVAPRPAADLRALLR